MSDIVGIELSQKPRRLHRFRNESSFARSDAEQVRGDGAFVKILCSGSFVVSRGIFGSV